ncbi:MAG: ankyrin repeat domain-containing protein [Kiritimatiellia bacterium]|jgi:hypothetical protein
MKKLCFCIALSASCMMPIHAMTSNSVPPALDPWERGEVDPCYKDATPPPSHSSESPVFLQDVATNGMSSTGMAFVYAWYGDAFRLFGLLDVMASNGVDATTLRMGSEHKAFTQHWDSPRFSLLHVAALRGHTNIVHELATRYGLSPNDRGPDGKIKSPLQALLGQRPDRMGLADASCQEYVAMALLLIELGARADGSRELGSAVASIKDERLVEALLKSGAAPNACEPEDLGPVIQLVDPSSDKILKLLIDHGADLDATNFLGHTIFDAAKVDSETKAQLTRLGLHPENDDQSKQIELGVNHEIVENSIHVSVINRSPDDVLLEIPEGGMEYRLEYELPDGMPDVKSRDRPIGECKRMLQPMSGRLPGGFFLCDSTYEFIVDCSDIPINFNKYYKLTVFPCAIPIGDLKSLSTIESLDAALFRNKQTMEIKHEIVR